MKTFQQLASEVAKREGKKSKSRIGDIREILHILSQIDADHLMEGGALSDCPVANLHLEQVAKVTMKARKKK
jgi:hypothetical protein